MGPSRLLPLAPVAFSSQLCTAGVTGCASSDVAARLATKRGQTTWNVPRNLSITIPPLVNIGTAFTGRTLTRSRTTARGFPTGLGGRLGYEYNAPEKSERRASEHLYATICGPDGGARGYNPGQQTTVQTRRGTMTLSKTMARAALASQLWTTHIHAVIGLNPDSASTPVAVKRPRTRGRITLSCKLRFRQGD